MQTLGQTASLLPLRLSTCSSLAESLRVPPPLRPAVEVSTAAGEIFLGLRMLCEGPRRCTL